VLEGALPCAVTVELRRAGVLAGPYLKSNKRLPWRLNLDSVGPIGVEIPGMKRAEEDTWNKGTREGL